MSDELIRFSVTVPEDLLSEFEAEYYSNTSDSQPSLTGPPQRTGRENRSEAIRNLMRAYISGQRWRNNTGEIYATITLVYDHHMPELTRKLTSAQHDNGEIIICSTHVHLNHETCLECIITKGLAENIKSFIETLKKIRGVKSLNVNVASEL